MINQPLVDIVIEKLGAQGDGLARHEGRIVYVPLVLPQEQVRVKIMQTVGNDGFLAELVEVLKPAPERMAPPCPHFSRCGGCSLQHVGADLYKAHKRNVITGALHQQHLDHVEVRELMVLPAHTRRRLSLCAQKAGKRIVLGFNAKASPMVIDLESCPIAKPELVALFPTLRTTLTPWLIKAKSLDVALTSTDTGIDILLTGPEPDLAAREGLQPLGSLPQIACISWRKNERSVSEPLMQMRQPLVTFDGAAVGVPPGAFLQASKESEALLTQLVTTALDKPGKVLDLFAGLGTFSLPLSKQHEVVAVEGDGPATTSLRLAAQGRKLKVETRDLFRDPLSGNELDGYSAAVFDPPRAGAQAQCQELAMSNIPTLIAVSCNPGTFARDAAILIGGGYKLDWVQPVDQFLWSSHVELVAKFSQ